MAGDVLRRAFKWLLGGALAFIALVIVTAIGTVALYAPEGRRLDDTSRKYVTYLLDTRLRGWDLTTIKAESSDELTSTTSDDRLAQLLQVFSARLGNIRSYGPLRGESSLHITPFHKIVTAEYVTAASFEKADGVISFRLIQKDHEWKLLAFNVQSEVLLR